MSRAPVQPFPSLEEGNAQYGAGGPAGGNPEQSRLSEAMTKFPLGTLFIAGVCGVVHAYVNVFDIDLNDLTISPYFVIYQYELYRLVVPSFVHANLMHIGMNMSSFMYLGVSIEKTFGTIYFLFIILSTTIVGNLLYISICFVIWKGTEDLQWLAYPSVGFSGVLFGLAVMDSYFSKQTHRSFYGVINVPSRVYPWVMLFGLQIMMELVGTRVSFMGHFTGLLVGIMHSYHLLCFLLPSIGLVKMLEQMPILVALTSRPNFLKVPDQFPRASNTEERTACCRDAWYGIKAGFRLLGQLMAFILSFFGFRTAGAQTATQYESVPIDDTGRNPWAASSRAGEQQQSGHRLGGSGLRLGQPHGPPQAAQQANTQAHQAAAVPQQAVKPTPAEDDENLQLQRALQLSLSEQQV